MAKAFSEEERDLIKSRLKLAARECAAKYGMKKTTVDQLVDWADISKGAFYKFYDTKEMLFFEMMEDMHSEIYGKAAEVLQSKEEISEKEKLANAFIQAISVMESNNLMNFFENELCFLLRKIPSEVKEKHYHSDDYHIKELMRQSGFKFTVSPEVASGVVRALILTISHRKEIGENYSNVMEILIRSVCDRLIK